MSVFSNFMNEVGKGLKKNAPSILLAAGITGSATAVVLGIASTPRALQIIREKEEEKGAPLTKKEAVKACWKVYIPTALALGSGIGCMVGSQVINVKRISMLTTAAQMSQTALIEYKNEVIKAVGEQREKEIQNTVNRQLEEKCVEPSQVIVIPNTGTVLCYDEYSDREFKSSKNEIDRVLIKLGKQIANSNEGAASLRDFYMEFEDVNFRPRDGDEELGWNIRNKDLNVIYGCDISPEGTPRLTIRFETNPYDGYTEWM